MDVTVRRAVAEDIGPMADVIAAVAPEGVLGTEPPVDVETVRERFRDTVTDDGPAAMWVAAAGGVVVGQIGLHPAPAPGVMAIGMALRPDARGRGIGRALLDAAVAHAREAGAHKVELEVWPDNARAIALYTAAGFEVEGVRRRHYRRRDGSLRSTLLMAVHLPG